MVTFILLAFFFLLGVMFSAVAYSSSARRRSGVHPGFPEIPAPPPTRVPGSN